MGFVSRVETVMLLIEGRAEQELMLMLMLVSSADADAGVCRYQKGRHPRGGTAGNNTDTPLCQRPMTPRTDGAIPMLKEQSS